MSIKTSRRSLLTTFGAAAIGLSFGLDGCSKPAAQSLNNGEAPKLNFFNWETYTGDTTLADFKKASGVDVNMTFFASNDELFAKLKTGNPGFDVIVPSNDYVTRMGQAGMLMPLDHAKIPNMKNISPEFLDPPYDPGRKYSMPYTWLVLGLGYRKSKMKPMDGGLMIPDSWKYVFESDLYKKRITVLGESNDLIRLAAKYLGYSINNIPDDGLPKIEALLMKQVKAGNLLKFTGDEGDSLLASGDADIVVEYNGDIAQRQAEDPDIDFVVPKEGSELNSDTLAIPTGAPRPLNAHAFIDFMLDATNAAEFATTRKYPTPNAAAKAMMPDSYAKNPIIFPSEAALAKCEYGEFPGAERAAKFEEIVTRVKNAGGMK